MIDRKKINKTLDEASQLISACKECLERFGQEGNENHVALMGCKETAAVRRKSMDLTRALTDLRRAN